MLLYRIFSTQSNMSDQDIISEAMGHLYAFLCIFLPVCGADRMTAELLASTPPRTRSRGCCTCSACTSTFKPSSAPSCVRRKSSTATRFRTTSCAHCRTSTRSAARRFACQSLFPLSHPSPSPADSDTSAARPGTPPLASIADSKFFDPLLPHDDWG